MASEALPRHFRHPLCTCPMAVEKVSGFTIERIKPEGSCPGGTNAHPVLSGEDIRRILGK